MQACCIYLQVNYAFPVCYDVCTTPARHTKLLTKVYCVFQRVNETLQSGNE